MVGLMNAFLRLSLYLISLTAAEFYETSRELEVVGRI
jgi:hypothetical protein